jgi:hypothetical protein
VTAEVLPRAPRVSAAEREWAVRRLRRGREDDRISLDTFASRLELVYAAESRGELLAAVSDLPRDGWATTLVVKAVAWASQSTERVRAAWQQPRLPALALPVSGGVVLGRARRCDCVLNDSAVSRRHALLQRIDGRWWLRDLGSMNGTYVNGLRVIDEVEVRAGDHITFGATTYRLTPPLRAAQPQRP